MYCIVLNIAAAVIIVHITIKNNGVREIFYISERSLSYELCLPRMHLINQKHSENSNIKKYYYSLKRTVFDLNIFLHVIYSSDNKADFSAAITPVFRVKWSFSNHSQMLIWCSRNISMLKTVVLHTCMETVVYLFMILWIESSKEQYLLKTVRFNILLQICINCDFWSTECILAENYNFSSYIFFNF